MLTAPHPASSASFHSGQQKTTPEALFAHKDNADLYWQALVYVAHGNKEDALQIVECIRTNKQISVAAPWRHDHPENIEDFFDKLFLDGIMDDPQLLSSLGLFESIGINEHNAHLTNASLEATQHRMAKARGHLLSLQRYNRNALSSDQALSHTLFLWKLNHTIAGEQFLFNHYTMSQLDGVLIGLTFLFTVFHRVESSGDAYLYIERLKKIPEQLRQTHALLTAQESQGIVPPRFTLEKVIATLQLSMPDDCKNTLLYSHLAQRIAPLNLPDQESILEQAVHVIKHDVYPAYQHLKDYFVQQLERTHTNHGVWALPDGDAYYAYMLKHHTTTDLSPQEIYALGLEEVAAIHTQMRALLVLEGITDTDKSIGQLLQEFSKKPEFYYPDTDAGRAHCLADYTTILERSRKELGHLFDLKPSAGVLIQRVPEHEQDGAPFAYYLAPSIDGSRPGVFFANLRTMTEAHKYSMETLTIHEAEPGHHFQLTLQGEMPLPMQRKIDGYNAYIEGWALYAEKLAYEHGFYSSPASTIGHFQDELLRAARLVIDTGIHYKRWTREQAVAYMQEATGYPYETAVSEVERYFVLPGQACSYKIGQLKILELRQRAKDLLGSKFDIKQFHNVVLSTGAVPLTVLEDVVMTYIRETLTK
jgi:uncharacterized protein (DUF885 family)